MVLKVIVVHMTWLLRFRRPSGCDRVSLPPGVLSPASQGGWRSSHEPSESPAQGKTQIFLLQSTCGQTQARRISSSFLAPS